MADDMRFAVCRRPGGNPFVMRVFGEGETIYTTYGCYRFEKGAWKALSWNNDLRIDALYDTDAEARENV